MGRLDGKVAIVTGAGQGIGLGIALALASEGASISIAELEADRARRAAEEVRARGVSVCAVTWHVPSLRSWFRRAIGLAPRANSAGFGRK